MITKFKIYESSIFKSKPKKDDEIFIKLMNKIKEEIDDNLDKLSSLEYSSSSIESIDYVMLDKSTVHLYLIKEYKSDSFGNYLMKTYRVSIRPYLESEFFLDVSDKLIKQALEFLNIKYNSKKLKDQYEKQKKYQSDKKRWSDNL